MHVYNDTWVEKSYSLVKYVHTLSSSEKETLANKKKLDKNAFRMRESCQKVFEHKGPDKRSHFPQCDRALVGTGRKLVERGLKQRDALSGSFHFLSPQILGDQKDTELLLDEEGLDFLLLLLKRLKTDQAAEMHICRRSDNFSNAAAAAQNFHARVDKKGRLS